MAYVYSQAQSLDNTEKVGSFQCVALVQHFASAPITSAWREGVRVMGNKNLTPGTAIATFENGRYPNRPHGNHAAFYLSQVANGIYVVDQWADMVKKPKISKRFIRAKGKSKTGKYMAPSNNADAYSVIE
ncbi:BPSL0067 family protein [Pseudoduganella sp. OTU4001]|uniref:BPSL0067 family protein n=1 Tax=Pseudoduganella sp. OTU4001 TaxID=3043854 RepID=UPI00313BEB84